MIDARKGREKGGGVNYDDRNGWWEEGCKGWGDKVMLRSHQCFHPVLTVKLMGVNVKKWNHFSHYYNQRC